MEIIIKLSAFAHIAPRLLSEWSEGNSLFLCASITKIVPRWQK